MKESKFTYFKIGDQVPDWILKVDSNKNNEKPIKIFLSDVEVEECDNGNTIVIRPVKKLKEKDIMIYLKNCSIYNPEKEIYILNKPIEKLDKCGDYSINIYWDNNDRAHIEYNS